MQRRGQRNTFSLFHRHSLDLNKINFKLFKKTEKRRTKKDMKARSGWNEAAIPRKSALFYLLIINIKREEKRKEMANKAGRDELFQKRSSDCLKCFGPADAVGTRALHNALWIHFRIRHFLQHKALKKRRVVLVRTHWLPACLAVPKTWQRVTKNRFLCYKLFPFLFGHFFLFSFLFDLNFFLFFHAIVLPDDVDGLAAHIVL